MDWPELQAFFLDPRSYPDPTGEVRVIETHISWVFLTDRFVYKVKKPVRFDFLDYSTLELRKKACDREVRLNRRLAADVYREVVPIGRGLSGFCFHPQAPVEEFAVCMRRLPEGRMLDHLVRTGAATAADIDRVLDILVPFYARHPLKRKLTGEAALASWRKNVRDNFKALRELPALAQEQPLNRLEAAHTQFLLLRPRLVMERAEGGFYRDGHGDLRAEHICLTDPPAIFDCVEFNDRLRQNDQADELAFLAMDLEFHGAADLAAAVHRGYVSRSGDAVGEPLWDFYRSYRACVRAKVAALTGGGLKDERAEAYFQAARRYLQLANFRALSFYRPMLLVVCGVMGTGKTTLAKALAKELALPHVQSDRVRKEMAAGDRSAGYGKGPYTEEADERVYAEMIHRADPILARGGSVVLDATFKRKALREKVAALARRWGVDMLLIQCTCPASAALARLDRRTRSGRSLSDGRPELYDEQVRQFEPMDDQPPGRLLTLDTQPPVPDLVNQVLKVLAERGST
jgi:hypothetical protein